MFYEAALTHKISRHQSQRGGVRLAGGTCAWCRDDDARDQTGIARKVLGSWKAIYVSNLQPDERARIFEWLKPRGKVFIQVGTIYAGHIKKLMPEFIRRRAEGMKWAGETEDAKAYVLEEFAAATPRFMNYLDAEPLVSAFEACGFKTERSWYYTRTGLPEVFHNDGREHFGYIGAKRS